MVRWCIRLTRLTLVCEVIRYRLVQVRQNQKRRHFVSPCACSHIPHPSHIHLKRTSMCGFSLNPPPPPLVRIEMPIFEVGVDGRERYRIEKFDICRRDRKSWSAQTFATVTHVKTWRFFVVKWWSQRQTSSDGQPTRKMKSPNWSWVKHRKRQPRFIDVHHQTK